jgi:2'-5' RNA ligase
MRLFVAVDLSEEIRENVSELSKIFAVKGIKTVEKENLHLTLKFLGEVHDSKKDRIVSALDEIEFERFKINFKGVGYFPGGSKLRVIWVGVESGAKQLETLANLVEDKMVELKFKKERKFVPHATIARVKRIDSNIKNRILKQLAEFQNREFGEMDVDHFSLKKSTLTPSGPIYEDVKIFKLK